MTPVARLGITALLGLLLTVGPVGSQPPGHLQPGSDPTVLPGPVLIADRGNDRLVLVDPEGRVIWPFTAPGVLRGAAYTIRPVSSAARTVHFRCGTATTS